MTIPIGENVFKPRRIKFLYLSIPFLLIGLLFSKTEERNLYAGFTTMGIMFFIFGSLTFIANYKSLLIINDEGITHKTLLKTRVVKWYEINMITHHFVWEGKRVYNEFAINTGKPVTCFQIASSYYSRKTLQQICSLLQHKIPDRVNDKIEQMSDGKFSWYVF